MKTATDIRVSEQKGYDLGLGVGVGFCLGSLGMLLMASLKCSVNSRMDYTVFQDQRQQQYVLRLSRPEQLPLVVSPPVVDPGRPYEERFLLCKGADGSCVTLEEYLETFPDTETRKAEDARIRGVVGLNQ